MQLYNSLSKRVEPFQPQNEVVTVYSCGPTVYDHAHIGNLSAFIFADTLRRTLTANGWKVKHVMNFTDVDDKTIRRSQADHPDLDPKDALSQTTRHFTDLFLHDFAAVGNDSEAYTFVRATDERTIAAMQAIVTELYRAGIAYIAEDGVYFSIDAYKKAGKTYGQLVELSEASTSQARIANDEYDKESAHDFALWKRQGEGEPAWDFGLDRQVIPGRPGWHIECSAMSRLELGQPFDIHTGGVDLKFPHHENEIAQSTACTDDPTYAHVFMHNEHILVDGRKMSKSLGNFYTLADIVEKHIDPIAFRLLVLQSHYRNQTNFSFDNVLAATSRLQRWRDVVALRWQTHDTLVDDDTKDETGTVNGTILSAPHAAQAAMMNDLNTPEALAAIDVAMDAIGAAPLGRIQHSALTSLVAWVDDVLGLQLGAATPDISDDEKRLILERKRVRESKDWAKSDELRDALLAKGIVLKDTATDTIWSRTSSTAS